MRGVAASPPFSAEKGERRLNTGLTGLAEHRSPLTFETDRGTPCSMTGLISPNGEPVSTGPCRPGAVDGSHRAPKLSVSPYFPGCGPVRDSPKKPNPHLVPTSVSRLHHPLLAPSPAPPRKITSLRTDPSRQYDVPPEDDIKESRARRPLLAHPRQAPPNWPLTKPPAKPRPRLLQPKAVPRRPRALADAR